jgi:hypothetical protein
MGTAMHHIELSQRLLSLMDASRKSLLETFTREESMIRLIAFAAFALALATSAEAMSPAPLHQPDGMITQVRYYGYGYRHYGYRHYGYRHYGYRRYGYGGYRPYGYRHYGYRHYGYRPYGYRPYGYGGYRHYGYRHYGYGGYRFFGYRHYGY